MQFKKCSQNSIIYALSTDWGGGPEKIKPGIPGGN